MSYRACYSIASGANNVRHFSRSSFPRLGALNVSSSRLGSRQFCYDHNSLLADSYLKRESLKLNSSSFSPRHAFSLNQFSRFSSTARRMNLFDLQPVALLLHPAALTKHLQIILKSDSSTKSINAINSHILHLAHTEAVPHSVYRVWLSNACKYEPTLLYGALRDQAAGVRIAAIKIISNIFTKPSRKERGWDSLGGAQGIKEILDGLPLVEVSSFVKAICQGGYNAGGRDLLATCFDELVALIDASDTWTSRSLSSYVAPLYSRCTSKKVAEILNSEATSPDKFYRDASRLHPNLFRQVAIGVVKSDPRKQIKILQDCAEILVASKEAYNPVYSTKIQSEIFSPGLRFGVDILSYMKTIEPEFCKGNMPRQWITLVLNLAIRRGVPFDTIMPIIKCGLDISRLVSSHNWLDSPLAKDVVRCWSMIRFGTFKDIPPFHPVMTKTHAASPSRPSAVNEVALEQILLDQVLNLEDHGLSENMQANLIDRLTRLLNNVHSQGRLQLLQLVCKHAPNLNFDLTAWPPSEKERELFPIWDYRILALLDPGHSKVLFQRQLKIHSCETFLSNTLIKQNSWNMSWELQCTLWASWEPGLILACGPDTRTAKLASISDVRADVQRANLALKGLLESCMLLLREPWAKPLMRSMTNMVGSMFNTILDLRFNAVKYYLSDELATESDLVETLLDSLLPIIIDFEREGNREGQAVFSWSGPAGLIKFFKRPVSPSRVNLSFVDRLQKARDELWKDLRVRLNPDVCILGPGWPRGLSIQNLTAGKVEWLYHALERPQEAPFLSSRANEILFSRRDIVIAAIPQVVEPNRDFVDSLGVAIRATVSLGEEEDKVKWLTRIWEHYSSVLHEHPLHLELFQEWMVGLLGNAHELISVIQPPVLPAPDLLLSRVPTGSELTEWDPQQDVEDMVEIDEHLVNEERPREIPCIFLNCLMQGSIRSRDRVVRTRAIKTRARTNPLAIWEGFSASNNEGRSGLFNNQEAIRLSALLYLDTFASQSRLLKMGFPDTEGSRYGPTYLADEFITRVANKDDPSWPMFKAVEALKRGPRDVPAQILRDLICSLLDTLKASPDAENYPSLLECTLDLIKVLLHSSQPQLVVEVVSRVWTEFPNDSSSHRKVSLSKIGRFLTPNQAEDLVDSLVGNACEALGNKKAIVKITTLKMIVQGLTEADFLAPSTRLLHLEKICSSSSQLDVRVEIVNSAFELLKQFCNAEPFKVLSRIALSAAGPSERDMASEHDWQEAEAGGPLIPILDDQRPILETIIEYPNKVPDKLRSEYVQKVILPLVTESVRQHTRWMNILLARLGLSLSDLGLTDSDIGPFSPDLVDLVVRKWANYLPGTYLQEHRGWALSYLHRDSFNQIHEAFKWTSDPVKNDVDVQGHLQCLLESQRSRCPFRFAYQYSSLVKGKEPNGITPELVLDEFVYRVNVFTRSPIAYNSFLNKYSIHPGYMLAVLHGLRQAREYNSKDNCPHDISFFTKLMTSIVDAAELVRKEGWSPGLTAHPVTIPTKMEYEIELLPSPRSKIISSSDSPLDAFLSGIDGLICKYAADPVLVMKVDAFAPILAEVEQKEKEGFALKLGEYCGDEHDQHRHVKTWVRAKLAVMVLPDRSGWNPLPLSSASLDMIEKWKGSDIEMVRQLAWAWDWDSNGSYVPRPYNGLE
ncbi:hypothetical protein N7495_003613 [Penicillium taxi]|uniref:uncharacterized protein n=1 Tax=Penicillium taxi TaxID=168475 RepID=UPI00254573C8|nr:uncharacterized protein N7495_003613 [Penicillium taxi]KAJ5898869.1 hypothetical protein N7495_003613 [Penicillium taxi]